MYILTKEPTLKGAIILSTEEYTNYASVPLEYMVLAGYNALKDIPYDFFSGKLYFHTCKKEYLDVDLLKDLCEKFPYPNRGRYGEIHYDKDNLTLYIIVDDKLKDSYVRVQTTKGHLVGEMTFPFDLDEFVHTLKSKLNVTITVLVEEEPLTTSVYLYHLPTLPFSILVKY
jgi:hypothetical protein